MKYNTRWVIVDTETDGLNTPIHVVEIGAQAMIGWEPDGEPFRVFLNHNVRMPHEAYRVHGYTEAFLAKEGMEPTKGHRLFSDYVRGDPIVCHNLNYDWNRALTPEWDRLGLVPAGCRGFCSMLLSRRVVHEFRDHGLDSLKNRFSIDSGRSHQALADVETVVKLFQRVYAPRLEAANINTFEAVSAFSKRTPVDKCREEILRHCDSPSR